MNNYFDLGYNNYLSRQSTQVDLSQGINSSNSGAFISGGSIGFGQTTLAKLEPNQDMESGNFEEGSTGWKIYGDGNAEFANITLTSGTLKYEKISFIDDTKKGYYIGAEGIYMGDVSDATKFKFDINTGLIDLVGTISGRLTNALAYGDSSGNLTQDVINTKLNTSTFYFWCFWCFTNW